MRTRSASPLSSPSQEEASKYTASNIGLSSRKRHPWWLQAVMKLWRVLRPQHHSRGSDPPEEGKRGSLNFAEPGSADKLITLIILCYRAERAFMIALFQSGCEEI